MLGNPGIFRQGGGGGIGTSGTRESQDIQTRGGSISWDLAPMYLELLYYIPCYLGFHSIV